MRLAVVLVLAGACAGGRADPFRECMTALDQVKAKDGPSYWSAMRTCTAVYSQPACRGALARIVDSPPDERQQRAAREEEVCRRVYCPLLAAPRPALCDSDTIDPTAFEALEQAILRHDLGAERAAELAARRKHALEVLLPPVSLVPEGPCDAALSIALRRDGVWLGTKAARRFVAACGGALDKAALAGEMCRLGRTPALSCSREASIVADGALPYADLVAAMDVAIQAGFSGTNVTDKLDLDFPPAAAPGETAPARCGQEAVPCLPRLTTAPPALPADDSAIHRAPVVALDRKGGLSLDGKPVALGALADALKARSPGAAEVEGTVILQIDRGTPSSQVTQLLKIAQAAGYANVQFAVSRNAAATSDPGPAP